MLASPRMRKPGDKMTPAMTHAARVEALKRAVREGRYPVDSAAVADRMLEQARETVRARLAGS